MEYRLLTTFKRINLFILVLLLCFPLVCSAAPINILINNQKVSFSDSTGYPFIDSSKRTQVPLRVTMEKCGCAVSWDSTNRVAKVTKNNKIVEVPIDASYILVSGAKIPTDTYARIVNNRTYLPIRPVLEAVGATVDWNGNTKTVMVEAVTYIGNKNSMIFHRSNCPSVARMNNSNKVAIGARSTAIEMGYTPCENCAP